MNPENIMLSEDNSRKKNCIMSLISWVQLLNCAPLFEIVWTARRPNQSILKEICPDYSLEGLMLKLKLQSFGHLIWRTDSLEKTLMLGKIESERRGGQQRMRWFDGITNSMDVSMSKLRERWWTGKPAVLQSMGSQSDTTAWTKLNILLCAYITFCLYLLCEAKPLAPPSTSCKVHN